MRANLRLPTEIARSIIAAATVADQTLKARFGHQVGRHSPISLRD
jgi:hypothetical protein